MNLPRCAGILLHPTSLPSRFGIGDFGPEAFRFVDWLYASGFRLWQVLPMGPVGFGDSPYQSCSAFAGETLFISPEPLVEERLLEKKDLETFPNCRQGTAEYRLAREWKQPLFAKAYHCFRKSPCPQQEHAFLQFCADQVSWLDDFALFVALKEHLGSERTWTSWDKDIARRSPVALAHYREKLRSEIEAQKYWQFLFYKQWCSLRRYCADRGIRIMGDIPLYVSHDSADVWANPKQFRLDSDGNPTSVSGVPPDYFSETGQLWGNPTYNWEELERTGFRWWIERFRGMFRLYDLLRVDHFRGFEAYWEVPAGELTAVNGRWTKAPGDKLFQAVTAALGSVEIVAENLGVITPEVEALREKFGFPGMAVLLFAFGLEGNAAWYRPHNYETKLAAYTGTHDNDTVMGWWNDGCRNNSRNEEDVRKEKELTLQYLGPECEPMNWMMLRALLGSVARVAIVPMQDVLGLGNEARMNRPGTAHGNWRWRMCPGVFTSDLQRHLRELAAVYDRIPAAVPMQNS